MNSTETLLSRNNAFAQSHNHADLPILPKLRSVILTCLDARVDPAHTLGLDLGEAVVIRNSGGRVTQEVLEELATLAFMVAKMDGDKPGPFEIIVIHHTQCGVERYANPDFQKAVCHALDIDVSSKAIIDHDQAINHDVNTLLKFEKLPSHVTVSGYLYDLSQGKLVEKIPSRQKKEHRVRP